MVECFQGYQLLLRSLTLKYSLVRHRLEYCQEFYRCLIDIDMTWKRWLTKGTCWPYLQLKSRCCKAEWPNKIWCFSSHIIWSIYKLLRIYPIWISQSRWLWLCCCHSHLIRLEQPWCRKEEENIVHCIGILLGYRFWWKWFYQYLHGKSKLFLPSNTLFSSFSRMILKLPPSFLPFLGFCWALPRQTWKAALLKSFQQDKVSVSSLPDAQLWSSWFHLQ